MDSLNMSSPWVEHANKLNALFDNDKEIIVSYDNDEHRVLLYVDNDVKAGAIDKIIKHEIVFGNVTLNVEVIPANSEPSMQMLLRRAFEGNPIVSSIETLQSPLFGETNHVMFVPEVVQYYNDNLYDYHGVTTTVYESIARDVLDTAAEDNVRFNTEIRYEKVFSEPPSL